MNTYLYIDDDSEAELLLEAPDAVTVKKKVIKALRKCLDKQTVKEHIDRLESGNATIRLLTQKELITMENNYNTLLNI